MKLTLKEIWISRVSLIELVNQKMEAKGKYWVAKQAKKIFSEIENIDERRVELMQKYGKKDKKGTSIPEDKLEKFNDEFNKLLDEEIDLDIDKVKYEYIEKLELKPATIVDLFYLINEPKEKND